MFIHKLSENWEMLLGEGKRLTSIKVKRSDAYNLVNLADLKINPSKSLLFWGTVKLPVSTVIDLANIF